MSRHAAHVVAIHDMLRHVTRVMSQWSTTECYLCFLFRGVNNTMTYASLITSRSLKFSEITTRQVTTH